MMELYLLHISWRYSVQSKNYSRPYFKMLIFSPEMAQQYN